MKKKRYKNQKRYLLRVKLRYAYWLFPSTFNYTYHVQP